MHARSYRHMPPRTYTRTLTPCTAGSGKGTAGVCSTSTGAHTRAQALWAAMAPGRQLTMSNQLGEIDLGRDFRAICLLPKVSLSGCTLHPNPRGGLPKQQAERASVSPGAPSLPGCWPLGGGRARVGSPARLCGPHLQGAAPAPRNGAWEQWRQSAPVRPGQGSPRSLPLPMPTGPGRTRRPLHPLRQHPDATSQTAHLAAPGQPPGKHLALL